MTQRLGLTRLSVKSMHLPLESIASAGIRASAAKVRGRRHRALRRRASST